MIHVVRVVSILAALLAPSSISAAQAEANESPAAAACVEIKTAADLNKIRANLFGSFCLAADLDLSSVANFRPIGQESGRPFLGTLDGRGHAIRNLKVRSSGRAGFFDRISGDLGPNAGVKNLRLINVSVISSGGDETGGLAAIQSGGSVTNVFVSGAVSGTDTSSIGGLLGEQLGGTTQRSRSTASVNAGKFGALIGGLVGYQGRDGIIVQSYATGAVTASGFDMKVGGLAGMAQGTIRYSFASGPVKATSTIDSQVGGLVGDAAPQSLPQFPTRGIFSSFATGSVTSIVGTRDAYAGGLAGLVHVVGAIDQTYAVGRIVVDKPAGVEFGGLLGDDCDCVYIDVLRSVLEYANDASCPQRWRRRAEHDAAAGEPAAGIQQLGLGHYARCDLPLSEVRRHGLPVSARHHGARVRDLHLPADQSAREERIFSPDQPTGPRFKGGRLHNYCARDRHHAAHRNAAKCADQRFLEWIGGSLEGGGDQSRFPWSTDCDRFGYSLGIRESHWPAPRPQDRPVTRVLHCRRNR